MELDIFNPSRVLRSTVLFWFSMLLSVISLLAATFSLAMTSHLHLVLVNFVFGCFSMFIAYRSYYNQIPTALSAIYVYVSIGVLYVTTAAYPIEKGLLFWSFLYPVLFYLILGKRNGFFATSIGFLGQFSLVIEKALGINSDSFIALNLNFMLAYAAVWLASHILEVKRKSSEASLGQLACRDALTGVYNRHALVHNFDRYRRESEKLPLSLLVLDLDYFKQVNDLHGHDIGDKVLIQTAALIDSLSDEHLVYRIGGEEFCIALHNTDAHLATRKAEQIRECIEKYSFNDRDCPISLTTSIGIYQCDHYDNLESVLKQADKELYKAKKNGRNQIMVCNQNSVAAA
ncbi:GGDEF domain-containing protein [Vibrio japonicus]|uniref:diguanylate cyclase n=1 Tax=Vibrio japonicus TaxID=1824638 RepID=A0ABY5LPN5_9VIBR|nr:diguanylate cyclase [Vibrio japonicus]UUM31700.1 diguanylate cyclase [Vibrio japonicus]